MLRVILLALALTLSACVADVPVAADTWDDAVAAHERGDYETALRLIRPLAEQGAAGAQFILGVMYFNGQGVPQDYVEAAKWYRRAAEQGNAWAQYNIGVTYEKGHGVPQDYAEAVKWYRPPAEQGLAAAQTTLGFMYVKGRGVPQDFVLTY